MARLDYAWVHIRVIRLRLYGWVSEEYLRLGRALLGEVEGVVQVEGQRVREDTRAEDPLQGVVGRARGG